MSPTTIEDLMKKTVPQLKSFAKQNSIDIFGSNTKKEIIEVIMSWMPNEQKPDAKAKPEPKKKVAVYALKNLHWSQIGSLKAGYNIVTKEESEKWLSHKAVRIATPEEIAKHYGKI